MSKYINPKGRRGLPDQLRNFGRHLVYSEGTKTEPFYVDNIKKCIADKYKVRANDIELVYASEGKSYNTLSLAKYAIKDVDERLRNDEIIDHVWVFYDKDSFPKSNYINAFKMVNGLNIAKNDEGVPCDSRGISWHSLPSNECFELFLLLYFNYETAALHRNRYPDKIDKIVQKTFPNFSYAKNLANIHDILVASGGKINNAIKFGKRLEKENGIENPSSKAYLFLEYFKPYMIDN